MLTMTPLGAEPPVTSLVPLTAILHAAPNNGTLGAVKVGIVALLLVLGGFLGWWIVQRDPAPIELVAAEQARSWAGILARIAVLCFVSALLSLLRPRWLPRMFRPPAQWFRPLVLTAA